MTHYKQPTIALIVLFIAFSSVACDRLQPGYYLTPGHVPTLPPSVTPTTGPITPSVTPPSTVMAFATFTLTPFGASPAPTATFTPTSTPTVEPCDETEGQIVDQTLSSAAALHEVHYRVYLPPCYSKSQRRYPVLYIFHGLGEGMDDSQWIRMGLTTAEDLGYARKSLPPMIIVMPNGNDANYSWDAGPFPAMIVDELIPTIESMFCTWNDPSRRAIGGLSRGGYWAFWIAFSHPELFSRVGGHSAFFYDADTPTDENPNNLVDKVRGIESLGLYLDHGADDHIVDVNLRDFVERLRKRGIEPEYVINPVGAHTEEYWSAHTADYLTFYADEWPREVTTYPSCHEPSP